MEQFCKNHSDKKALSICHNCSDSFCEECLIEGDVYYYCKKPECLDRYKTEFQSTQKKTKSYYAKLSDRFVAILFDYFVLFIINSIIATPFYLQNPQFIYDDKIVEFGWFVIFRYPFGYFVGLLYFSIMESSKKMGSFGKRWQKIVVTNIYGHQISFLRALWRNFNKFPILPIILLVIIIQFTVAGASLVYILTILIYLLPLFTKTNQALHDYLSKTIVLDSEYLQELISRNKQTCPICETENKLLLNEVINNKYLCKNCKSINQI